MPLEALAPTRPKPEIILRLEQRDIREHWLLAVAARALQRMQRLSAIDLAIFTHVAAALREDAAALDDWGKLAPAIPVLPAGTRNSHPIASTLVEAVRATNAPDGLWVLLALLCELTLAGDSGEQGRLKDLSASIRSAFEKGATSELQALLGSAANLPEIQALLNRRIADGAPPLHKSFEGSWKSWLGPRVSALIAVNPAALRRALKVPATLPGLDAAALTLASSDTDPDDAADVPVTLSAPLLPGELIRGQVIEHQRAIAAELVRASAGDLLVPADQFVPVELIQQLARNTVARAQSLQTRGEALASMPYVALALSMATGLRELDLHDVIWGESPGDHPVISPSRPILIRPVIRPPKAVQPDENWQPWLEPRLDHVHWPLPPSVHDLLRALATNSTPRIGAPALPDSVGGQTSQLFRVIDELAPGLRIGTLLIRQALAAELAKALGADVAQLVLSDTFSMTAAATYYSAPRHDAVMTVARHLLERWFGVSCAPPMRIEGTFGSRLVPASQALQKWSAVLRKQCRAAAHLSQSTALAAWIAQRNLLAGALCAVTGHRPVNAIGDIDLDQVIPDHGLIILNDKQIDPLRKTRIAATGGRWLVEFRSFLHRLMGVAAQTDWPEGAQLAAAILRSEAPLFSVPGPDGPSRLTAAQLVATMPEAFRSAPNFYRHRLNQELMRRGTEAELRYAQLGWVVSPAHATSDLSPFAPKDLAAELAPTLDAILLDDGWFTASQRLSPWMWPDIPLRPLRDWEVVAQEHVRDHEAAVRRLRRDLFERGRAVEPKVLQRLAQAFSEFFPLLRLNMATRSLERVVVSREAPVLIDDEHWELLRDRVRLMDERPQDALEAAVTCLVLHGLLRKSHRTGITHGTLPRRPRFSTTTQPSPFLPGLGLAVRHAELLRHHVMTLTPRARAHDQGPLALLTVLLYSPYRSADWAAAAVNAAPDLTRAQTPGDCVRVPASLNAKPFHMVFNGLAPLALAKRGHEAPTARAPDPAICSRWLFRLKTGLIAREDGALASVALTAQAAGRLELSGPERLVMLQHVAMTTITVDRAIAQDDAWPVGTMAPDQLPREAPATSRVEPETDASSITPLQTAPQNLYERLTALLNPETFASVTGRPSDGKRGWQRELMRHLAMLLKEIGPRTTLGLITSFALHRLEHGGERRKRIKPTTLHTNVTRFSGALFRLAAHRDLFTMDEAALRTIYLAILMGKPPTTRPLVVESLELFQHYLEECELFPEVTFDELTALAGPRLISTCAGLLTDPEVHGVYKVLLQDLDDERARPDAAPEFVRLATLRVIQFVLLEGSGVRPASAHGLLLSDLHLLGEGRDFVHLHTSGAFGSVKTSTSVGFVPLQGPLWAQARPFVVAWLKEEKQLITDAEARKTPLFAATTGGKKRFKKEVLQSRLRELLRWVTGDTKAIPYWLRKRRVMAHHRRVEDEGGRPRAHIVYGALCASGHADITTALQSYICDPAIPLARSLREGRQAARIDILAITGADAAPLDMAWQRRNAKRPDQRLTVAFERIPIPTQASPERTFHPPPPLNRQGVLLPRHLDLFARGLRKGKSIANAALLAGLSTDQIERLEQATKDLGKKGLPIPWAPPSLLKPRGVMRAPRQLDGTRGILDVLSSPPSATLIALADVWVASVAIERFTAVRPAFLLLRNDQLAMMREAFTSMTIDADHVRTRCERDDWVVWIERPANTDTRQTTAHAAISWVLALVWLHQRVIRPMDSLRASSA